MPLARCHGPAGLAASPRPRWEVADILRLHGQAFRRSNPLPVSQLKIMSAIERCRTPALGGHLEKCDLCGFERPAYNSCRNRHCPKCQGLNKARWLQARQAEVLPVGYFHAVFTLPHELNALILSNKRLLLKILFDAAAQTLLTFGHNNFGGKTGFIAVLHTWDQRLNAHFHLPCLVPAGALSENNDRWINAPKNFLFPVRALALVFRGKYLDFLLQANACRMLIFPGQAAQFQTQTGFSGLTAQLRQKRWVVYAKPPFGGPDKVLDYLGRYTHRVAISNNRILNVENGSVTFAFRDRTDDNKRKAMSLPAEEFIRRFLLHSLPAAFVRLRHFGFLANRAKKHDLPLCRQLLGVSLQPPAPERKSDEELLQELTGEDFFRCPCCKQGSMRVVAELPKPVFPPFNSS
ncbi:MAG: IS91 family transposase [Elusimicrobiota bacterium]|nr:IS91 family transposase [Elusimicrobiota bacterium]